VGDIHVSSTSSIAPSLKYDIEANAAAATAAATAVPGRVFGDRLNLRLARLSIGNNDSRHDGSSSFVHSG
jgi:hypothetical protein